MPKQRYEEIADDLRTKIASGEYPVGSNLPSRSQMCQTYGVSDNVVGKAMLILRLEGLTETLAGVGVKVKRRPS